MKDLKEFSFYLDAWNYCRMHNLDLSKIVKKDFRTWNIENVYG